MNILNNLFKHYQTVRFHSRYWMMKFLILILMVILVACGGDNNSSNGNSNSQTTGSSFNSSRVQQVFNSLFISVRSINSSDIRSCPNKAGYYEAFVTYELYDTLFNRWTPFSGWYIFWSPYTENTVVQGRCG